MIQPTRTSSDDGDDGGDEEDTGGGGGGDAVSNVTVKWRAFIGRYDPSCSDASSKLTSDTMMFGLLMFLIPCTLANITFREYHGVLPMQEMKQFQRPRPLRTPYITPMGEKQTDVDARLGTPGFLPCELEPNNVTDGFIMTSRCGMVHSVKWYRGATRIFLYTGGIRVTQPQRDGYSDRYDNVYWSATPGNTTGFLVIDNITALDEGIYKCEITYTKVHEGCNIIQFINLTTFSDPASIGVGTFAEPGDLSAFNYDDPKSDFYDTKESYPKFGIMKRLITGNNVGPVDEGSKIRLVCRAGRTRPIPQITWWQHNRGQIYDDEMIDYQYRSVDSDDYDDYYDYTGLYVSQSILTVVGKRGANGRYECRVRTVTESTKSLAAAIDVIVNVSPYSVEMSSSTSGPTVSKISKVDDGQTSQNGEQDKKADEVVYAETTEGQPLVIRCAARGARPQANVTWYYYYNDQQDDDNDYASGIRNEFNARTQSLQPSKSSKHGPPVMLGGTHRINSGSATPRMPSDYLISETRRVENGAEIIGPVEIAQHTEYQSDGTRDTHSQLSMSQLHRQQDGSVLRCDAFNHVGSSPSHPLTVNMTIRVKFMPTAWVVPLTDGENSGAIVEDEIKTEIDQQHKGPESINFNPGVNDGSKPTDDGLHYQTYLYTVLVNETKELRLLCAFHANPDKLRTPVKWYHDGNELQLVDEDEQTQSNYGPPYLMHANIGNLLNSRYPAKYARVKGSPNGNNRLYGDGNGEDATVLVIRRLTRSDSGRYECRVRNSVGAANSTNFANVRVQYSPKVKLQVILDDSHGDNQTSSNMMIGPNPIVIESEHRNVTLRCAVKLESDQENMEDIESDQSLNLTFVHWYWNGVQMQLPNCTKASDSNSFNSEPFEIEHTEGNTDFDVSQENDNAMNVNYYTDAREGDPDYDSINVDNETKKRNRKLRKIVCTERELILVNVTKNIHGNYSCRARNAAGLLTTMSDQTPLIVYFAPGPVTLEFNPALVIKDRNVTLRCNAQYLGRPQHPTRYSWYRNGHPIYHQNQGMTNSGTGSISISSGNIGAGNFNPEWFIEHVSLETHANFTCSAWNEGGITYSEPVSIEVKAPPKYITGPPQYLGVAFNATHVNASCTVECSPTCSVYWLRRGVLIDPINNEYDRQRYVILIETVNETRTKNDFEAVRSTLIWRMENWPGGMGLDPITDSTEYSCRSSGNEVGPPVDETIMNFSVEYPPGNMTVSKSIVHVNEGNIPEKVFCHAEGRPLPFFEWRFATITNNWKVSGNNATLSPTQQKLLVSSINGGVDTSVGSISGGSSQTNNQQLALNAAVTRQQAGYYACIARNTHGNGTAYTYLDVMYKPSCQLRLMTVDQLKQETTNGVEQASESGTEDLNTILSSYSGEKRVLVCTATANPSQVQYTWTVRNSGRQNDTSTPSSLTSDSPASDRIITVAMRSTKDGSTDMDSAESWNQSVLILHDILEVPDDENDNDNEENGKSNDNAPNKPAEGVRTYVCTVNNTVGWDQCTIQVQAISESESHNIVYYNIY
ncbi:Hypothetical protein CINCED_3A020233 [Cinara cedri]|uniref:Ig-like domain-containing protein n=1 Tax=Cinara cedri TaxID=506608 RepID=A0A5E4LWS2_9HEMI|nr:Hypothetical protein CINCED_3A020233 [Cinara cedri]